MASEMVVYWPRHLWASGASTSSPACIRLSPDAVCVVATDFEASGDSKLLPPDSKCRRIVLFDAEIAALGGFSSLHSPQLLERLGRQFVDHREDEKTRQNVEELAPTSKGAALSLWLLETVGHYVVSLPFALLLIVADIFQRVVEGFQTPNWMVAGGGKSLAELSTFLAVFVHQLHNTTSLPRKLRQIYVTSEQRRLSRQEKVRLLEVCNWICFTLLDVVLGRLVFLYMGELALSTFQSAEISPLTVVDFLRDNVEWLMGAPAGFKLNKPLASILGNGILLWLDLWSFVFAEIFPRGCGGAGEWLVVMFGYMGVTLQLTLLADLVNLATWHSHWVYLYFAKLNRLQFGLFSSLSKLFLGQKINVLRHRVDSCEYDVSQLLLGTLLFTILAFLVTTNLVFFVFFAAVRGIIVLISLLLWLPVVALSSLPLASLVYRVWTPHFFVIGMQLQSCNGTATAFGKTASLENVGVGCRQPRLDVQNRRALRRALASWETSDSESCEGAYFELVPVVCSSSAHFTRLRVYLKTIATRYSLSAILQAWLFGKADIARVPIDVLFGLPTSIKPIELCPVKRDGIDRMFPDDARRVEC